MSEILGGTSLYKAVLMDLDGTLRLPEPNALPSDEVAMAIEELRVRRDIHAAVVTGLPAELALPSITSLRIDEPCVVNGGCEILRPDNGTIEYSQPMAATAQRAALEICRDFNVPLYDSENQYPSLRKSRPIRWKWQIAERHQNPKLFAEGLEPTQATQIVRELNKVSALAAVATSSFMGNDVRDIHITDTKGTKAYGVRAVIDMMELTPTQVIGIGDGDNDIPFLAIVGRSVAMGNASPAVLEMADEVADTVERDGVAKYLRGLYLLKRSEVEIEPVDEQAHR